MAYRRKDGPLVLGVAVAVGLTLCFSALAFTYLRNPPPDDPWTYADLPGRSPEVALNDIAAELLGGRIRLDKIAAPGSPSDSHQLHFTSRDKPLLVRVLPDPDDKLMGRLVWDTPAGHRVICRGIRPGGFSVMEVSYGWILRLEVVRMDRDGRPTELVATKSVQRPAAPKKK
jgi:hypothetical protein